jgi:hypothetical protein
MRPVYTYKALGHTVFLYGFRSFDFFVVIVGPLLIAIAVSYLFGALCLIGLWYAAKKLKHRPPGYFSSMFLFFVTPCNLAVRPYSDVISYKDMKNADKPDNA